MIFFAFKLIVLNILNIKGFNKAFGYLDIFGIKTFKLNLFILNFQLKTYNKKQKPINLEF